MRCCRGARTQATPASTSRRASGVVLEPGERALVATGVAVAIPPGYAGYVQPRSGLAIEHGITIVNTPGLVDSGYRGELRIVLLNTDREHAVRGRARDADRAARDPAGAAGRAARRRRAAGVRARRARFRLVARRRWAEPRIRVSALLRWQRADPALPAREAGASEYWLLPGGGVDMGESLTDALHRELSEELGIDEEVPVEGPVCIVDSIAPKLALRAKHVVHIVFAGRPARPLARRRALRGRRRSRPPPLLGRRARHDRAAPADPALPAPLAARRPARLSRRALGCRSSSRCGRPRPQPLRRADAQPQRLRDRQTASTPSRTLSTTIAMCMPTLNESSALAARVAAKQIEQQPLLGTCAAGGDRQQRR